MELKYVSDYSLDLCLEYMKHDNVYDRFSYTWEEQGDCYFITFIEYKNSWWRTLKNASKPLFKVTFQEMGTQTGITVQLLSDLLFVMTKDIDLFWEKKLGAKRQMEEKEQKEQIAQEQSEQQPPMSKRKFAVVIAANYLLVLVACLIYRLGWPAFFVLVGLQTFLGICNLVIAPKVSTLIVIQINLVISSILAFFLIIYLYYINISSDYATYIIGYLSVFIGATSAVSLSVFTAVIKMLINEKRVKQEKQE